MLKQSENQLLTQVSRGLARAILGALFVEFVPVITSDLAMVNPVDGVERTAAAVPSMQEDLAR